MRLQYASFLIPLFPDSTEQEILNRFLRGHRIIQTRKELVAMGSESYWAFIVEYLEHAEKNIGDQQGKNKIDYKEILSTDDFLLYSKLRDVRKKLAEENGLPVYAVCTNEQLAEIAKRKPKNITEFKNIEGIGQGKAEKYVPALLDCVVSAKNEDSTAIF